MVLKIHVHQRSQTFRSFSGAAPIVRRYRPDAIAGCRSLWGVKILLAAKYVVLGYVAIPFDDSYPRVRLSRGMRCAE